MTAEEIDAKSPIDDALMEKIKDNDDDLNLRVITAGNSPFVWEVGGPLRSIAAFKRSLAFGLVNKEFTPSICRFMLKKSGTSGNLAFDLRTHTRLNLPIQGVDFQYYGTTQSIARVASISTQSIARTTSQVSTQSITFAKTALNVQSIVAVQGANRWRYNFDAAPDATFVVGLSILFSSCTAGGNNGTFVIKEVNQSGGFNVVVENASGVAQTSAAGSGQLQVMSYNFTNPVNANFVVGESATFASHTSGLNDGTFEIVAVNSSGNNVWVKNPVGIAQGAAAGNMNVNRWTYAYSTAVSTTFFVVGQTCNFSSHSTGGNNGSFPIKAVNASGNNIVVYNTGGATQGAAAGTANPFHWVYSVAEDPTSDVAVADTIYASGHTTPGNNAVLTVSAVSSSTVTFYNASGATQAGVAGTLAHTRKIIKFSSDQAANFTLLSYIEMIDCPSGYYNSAAHRAPFQVLQINRGGGANYNVVVDVPLGSRWPTQAAGMLTVEMKSIFNTAPSLAYSKTGLTGDENIVGVSTDLLGTAILAQTPIMLYLTEVMGGSPQDLTVLLA
jgi:hypothetical protein